MEKWADFLISEVKYDRERRYILKVKVYEDLGEEVGYPEEMSRHELMELINQGKKFCTITPVVKRACIHKGQELYVIDLDGYTFLRTDFISTDDQSAKRDKLENIPEFA